MDSSKLTSLVEAGKIAVAAHAEARRLSEPGVNLLEIEENVRKLIEKAGAVPAFLGYKGYPAATCLSVNEEIVHGIPHDYILEAGDVLAVDLGVSVDGWIVDTARTHAVGTVNASVAHLLNVTAEALNRAITVCRPGHTTGDIGAIVESTAKKGGVAVVRELTGHGVGRTLQEEPSIPNYGRNGTGKSLQSGMVIAVEPITTIKNTDIAVLSDGWTIIARNGSVAAHFEDTIVVTDGDPIVLTR